MRVDWLSWSNPVSVWWGFLLVVSSINVFFWLRLHRYLRRITLRFELLVFLSAAYVFGCAFRAILPRADVQRICLFDTWLSSVFLGRSVATVAEICFVTQWALVLRHLAGTAESITTRNIANAIVPMIVLAECCSWYAVITTSYLGNTLENSLWAVTFLLIAVALLLLLDKFAGTMRLVIAAALLGVLGYVAFMFTVDVPMYFERWQTDLASGKELLGLFAGLYDVTTRWVVTHRIALWSDEIAWMSLYFSVAVWTSLALCGFVLVKDRLSQYRATAAWSPRLMARLLAVEVTDAVQSSGAGRNRMRRMD
ncbi:MAG: hypothetical protein AUI16_28635 [Alphaproteobacteria bacterium 13_2_20CM_2_64_7]|jgi:hypothetical protein|nr:MAG: hypothetical protein AUI16_28635 [Alphaproteobacteria bacterium 13_2_20CM_2_64_7]